MNIQSIKHLVEQHNLAQLVKAEEDLLGGLALAITVEGADAGEQLTHVLAAIWVHEHMRTHNVAVMPAIREYGKRVRESLS